MKKIILLFVFVSSMTFAQKSINDYAYVIVPIKFDFQKSDNQYRINTIVKKTLEDNNFNAYYENMLPQEVLDNRCKALTAYVENESNMFTTKLRFLFKDCNGVVLYSADEGKSKVKQYEAAYREALEETMQQLSFLNYKYTAPQVVEKKELVVETRYEPDPKQVIEVKQEAKEIEEVSAQNSTEFVQEDDSNTLYAQPIENGYQLIDTTPKVVYVLQNSGSPDLFIVKEGGLLRKVGEEWVLERYENNTLVQKKLVIKF